MPEAAPSKASPPPRLHVLLARETPLGLIIRRGPRRYSCTILWNRTNDTFQLGQWVKARLYPERCDLSPDGQHFIYFALDARWFGESHGSYTAVSRAPYLKALSFYPQGDTWGGGGLFADNYRFYASMPRDSSAREATQLMRIGEAPDYPHESYFVTRMKRDGWTLIGPPRPYTYILERPLTHGWSLRCTKVWLTDRYELFDDEQTLPQPDWTWADLDGSRLVYTAQGCLWTSPITETGLRESHLLHDFNGMKFEPRVAPY